MILFFSGTGNSEYVAKRIAKGVNDETINLFNKIKNNDYTELYSDSPWIVVVPTYAWRIPRIVQHYLEQTKLSGNNKIYFVMTCGGSVGNATKYLQELCNKKNMDYCGCAEVVMPENYIAMFSSPTKEKAFDIINFAEPVVDKIINTLQKEEKFIKTKISLNDRINSGIVNKIFYPMFVHAKKFYATDACVSCNKCAQVCPLNNVQMKDGKPSWGKNCTHCMACICKCPTNAIEYGEHSKGLVRYTCPKKLKND